jgi:hypothetical protein
MQEQLRCLCCCVRVCLLRNAHRKRPAQVPADTLEPFLDKLSDEALRQYVLAGVGVIHDTLTVDELDIINLLFSRGAIQVLVVTSTMCRAVGSSGALVVVLGTQFYDSSGLGGDDFPVAELVQMLGLSSRPDKDAEGTCVLMCHSAKKEYYKKFLFEPLPVESHLDTCLQDHIVRHSLACPSRLLLHPLSFSSFFTSFCTADCNQPVEAMADWVPLVGDGLCAVGWAKSRVHSRLPR